MTAIHETAIAGVKLARLQAFADERGRFLETFRKSWFPEHEWDAVQGNRSDSAAGVLRGLHFHRKQADYWYLLSGRVQVGLYDMRPGSPSEGSGETFLMTADDPVGVLIPRGVAHGFLTLEPSVLTYLVDAYYDDTDELGVAWNDPQIGLDWELDDPILSPRDQGNPRLADVAPNLLVPYNE